MLLTSLRPGITLKLMPSEIEVCPDEVALVNVLVTNSGDDRLENVALTLNGTTLATLGSLQPDEFRVIDSKTVVSNNCTIQFEATGRDSRGRVLSDRASAKVATVVAALKIFVSSSPPAIVPGEKSLLTCTVANTGMVPLYGIFVISKRLGPLGNIEYISPKRQMTVAAEKIVSDAVDDTMIAEGFAQNKRICARHFPIESEAPQLASPGHGGFQQSHIQPLATVCREDGIGQHRHRQCQPALQPAFSRGDILRGIENYGQRCGELGQRAKQCGIG